MFAIEYPSGKPNQVKRTWNKSFNKKVSASKLNSLIADDRHTLETPVSVQQQNTSKPISNNAVGSIYTILQEYFTYSTLHGIRYSGDRSISFGERLFWFCSFLGAIGFASYFISNVYSKYDNNPMIISLSPTSTALNSLPFPAVTICSTNQAKRSEAEYILDHGSDIEKILLDDYCNSNISSNLSTIADEATKWENVMKFILRVNPSCQETLKACIWKREEQICDELFNNDITDDGLCCTFNALPKTYIFRNPETMASLNLTFPSQVDDWNPEIGYSKNATLNTLPWRALGAGAHLGLTVVLDAQTHVYYCSSVASIGFKILLHNPLETPKMADYALVIQPGFEARIIIKPKIFDATPAVEGIDIRKRMCYFTNERKLQFYRTYTELNCKLECQANYTLTLCGCVPFYLPKNKFKRICSKKKEICADEAKEIMETPTLNGTNCNCLPACFELGYDATATYGKLSNMFKVREEIIKNASPDYFMTNMAVLHFYFVETQFTGNTKNVLYGFSEFLSNTGGLLGLFMGFSFLSAVEIAYYLTLRILCKVIRSKIKKRAIDRKDRLTNPALVYPFSK